MKAAWYEKQGPARQVLDSGGDAGSPSEAKVSVAEDLNSACGRMVRLRNRRIPLSEIARAHELSEHLSRPGRVVVIV